MKCERCNADCELCPENYPWSGPHWICGECDSTYAIEDRCPECGSTDVINAD